MRHLRLIFDQPRAVGLRLHPAKCDFASPQWYYLGHLITVDGILPNHEKVEAVGSFKIMRKQERKGKRFCSWLRKEVSMTRSYKRVCLL